MRLGRMNPLPRSLGVLDTAFWVTVSFTGTEDSTLQTSFVLDDLALTVS